MAKCRTLNQQEFQEMNYKFVQLCSNTTSGEILLCIILIAVSEFQDITDISIKQNVSNDTFACQYYPTLLLLTDSKYKFTVTYAR